jgi:3-dehydroquinate synthase
MRTVDVRTGSGSYEVIVGPGLLAEAGRRLRDLGYSGRAAVISDSTVRGLYGPAVEASLTTAGFSVALLDGPEREEQKSLDTAARLYEELTDFHAERNTPIVALGGGVVGDLAGFCAATYLRGVPLVQAPTTLLAQADSSLGGKTAVNHGQLKNKIGAFYQPQLTISDTSTLRTLSPGQVGDGLAEIIKHGAIRDAGFFARLENDMERVVALDDEMLEQVVARSAEIKAAVVEHDELDLGLRNILNYGHTIGHALETVSDFALNHGQAVSIGMVAAARISRAMGLLDTADVTRLRELLARAGLPTGMPGLEPSQVLDAMQYDKKIASGRVRFVLLRAIGDVFVTEDVEPALVAEVLGEAA